MWNYQIGKYKYKGETYYGLFEMIEFDGKKGWTEDPVALEYSESPEDIISQLKYMLKDAKHYDVFDAE